jgi:hypothetical protein
MREIAAREDVSLIGVSGALTMHALDKVGTVSRGALCGVQVVGGLLNRHVIGHYASALQTVRERGFYQMLRDSSAPYVEAVWKNFAAERDTWTEQFVGGSFFRRASRAVSAWLRRGKGEGKTETAASLEGAAPAAESHSAGS